MVRKGTGELTTNIQEMDEVIKEAWRAVNMRYADRREPSLTVFMNRYRTHIRCSPMAARRLDAQTLHARARKMGEKTANGIDLWSIRLLKRLPGLFRDKLADLLRVVEATGKWPDRVAEGFTSLVSKGEGGGDPMKLRPLTVLLQIYRIWAGVRMEDAMKWQETWAHEESYAFRPHKGSLDAAAVLTLVIELAHVLKTPLSGVGTDYTKCFDLIPQAISIAMLNIQGMDKGVLSAFHGMYGQLQQVFKIGQCLGAWWKATNGIHQGCPLNVIVIDALTSTWKRVIDEVIRPIVISAKQLPPQPKGPELPTSSWPQRGEGVEQRWVWICQTPCCCSEMGWKVGDEWRLPPNPDKRGERPPPPPRPRPGDPGELTKATLVWARLGLEELPSLASTETSRASLRAPKEGEPLSPVRPRVLFDETDDSSSTSEDAGHGDDGAAPGVEVRISAEGYADDTYMLAMCIMTPHLMLMATGQWVQPTGQGINVKKSMLFGVRGARGTTAPPLRAELNEEALLVQHEFRQLGVGLRTTITKGTGPLLEARIGSANQALRKVHTLPVGFEGRAIIVAIMVLAAGLYGVQLAEAGLKHIVGLDTAVMHALWGTSSPCRAKEIVFALWAPGHRGAPSMVVPYHTICWLARMARTRGTPQTIAQAIWEHRTTNRVQRPMGQALKELSRLGWQATCGWWQWTYSGALAPVNMAMESQEAVEHVVREELRRRELLQAEHCRPRLFAGIGGSIHRGLTLAYLHPCTAELDKSIMRGALTGAIWTAVCANERGLWPTRVCPYREKQEPEDEEHLL